MPRIQEESIASLAQHAHVPTSFWVRSRLKVECLPEFVEERVSPFEKDYDQLEAPFSWRTQFDTRMWTILSAWDGDERIGGLVIAQRTPGLTMLEGRNDIAAIWDIRVSNTWRHRGVGKSLMQAVDYWARQQGIRELKVETQDINVPACRLYRYAGFRLAEVNPGAYPGLNETQLIWRKPLIAIR